MKTEFQGQYDKGGGLGERQHFKSSLLDQYNSTITRMVNSLSSFQFTLFAAPQNHFTASANRLFCC